MVSHHINGLVQDRRNSITNALELRLSCTNPSISKLAPVPPLYGPVAQYEGHQLKWCSANQVGHTVDYPLLVKHYNGNRSITKNTNQKWQKTLVQLT